MQPKILCLILSMILLGRQVESAKILGVFPVPVRSHFFVGQAIMKSLHEAGHEITVISPYTQKTPIKSWRDIETTEMVPQTKGIIKLIKLFQNKNVGVSNFFFFTRISDKFFRDVK